MSRGEQCGVSQHRDGGTTQRRGCRCGVRPSQQSGGAGKRRQGARLGDMEAEQGQESGDNCREAWDSRDSRGTEWIGS